MSDDKQPELTPKEQQAQDQQRVQAQLIVTDVNRQVQNVMASFGFGRSGRSGRTSFEGDELNAMIDLIENSNPEHLEDAGQALLKARSAINKAANELGDFIRDVDWEGESGIAFRDWGNGLVAHAMELGDFPAAARQPPGPQVRRGHRGPEADRWQPGVRRGGEGREGPPGGHQPGEQAGFVLLGFGGDAGGAGAAAVR
jgi:hypothetical protein